MQHLRNARTHPGPFAGGHDHDGGSGHVSHRSIGPSQHTLWGVVYLAAREALALEDRVRILAPQLWRRPSQMRHVFVSRRGPRYSEAQARVAIAESFSYAEALRMLGMRAAGGNWKTLRRYATEVWHIPVAHFDPRRHQRARR
jgi:hypothetical protein